jgi:hypothetical protein
VRDRERERGERERERERARPDLGREREVVRVRLHRKGEKDKCFYSVKILYLLLQRDAASARLHSYRKNIFTR